MSSFDPPITPDPLTPGSTSPGTVGAGTSGLGGSTPPDTMIPGGTTPGSTTPGSTTGSSGGAAPKEVAGTAVEQGKEVAATAAQGAKEVAGQATQQATDVVRTATEEARRMASQVGGEARTQADSQAERLAENLRGIAGQLQAAASGRPLEAGPVRDLADQAGTKVDMFANRLADGGLDGLMQDVGTFARRRPGMFLASALGAGFVAGRLVRGARAAASDSSTGSSTPSVGTTGTTGTPYATPPIDLTGPADLPIPAADVTVAGAGAVDPTLVGGVGPMDAPTAGIS